MAILKTSGPPSAAAGRESSLEGGRGGIKRKSPMVEPGGNFPAPSSKKRSEDPPDEDLRFSLGCAGPPLQAAWAGRKDEFIDGFGVCSPGRWHPAARGLRKTAVQRAFVQRLRGILDEFCLNNLPDVARSTFMLATGKIQQSPFSDSPIANFRSKWFSLLPNSSLAAEVPEFQPFYLHALSQTMEMLGDPDFAILDRECDGNFAEGVPVGHREPLSHVCQVFRKRRKDQKYDETELQLDMMNFQTDSDAEKALQQQFVEEEACGRMFFVGAIGSAKVSR